MKQVMMVLLLACGLAVAQNFTIRTSALGDDFVIGMARTSEPVERVEIFGEFLDSAGEVVTVASADALVSASKAHEDIPFVITFEGEGVEDYELDVQGQPGEAPDRLIASNFQTAEDMFGTELHGVITNPTTQAMTVGRVVAAGFVGARIVSLGRTFPLLTIPAGDSRRFDVLMGYQTDTPVDFQVWVEARPD